MGEVKTQKKNSDEKEKPSETKEKIYTQQNEDNSPQRNLKMK